MFYPGALSLFDVDDGSCGETRWRIRRRGRTWIGRLGRRRPGCRGHPYPNAQRDG